jgi:hypothetical protein
MDKNPKDWSGSRESFENVANFLIKNILKL